MSAVYQQTADTLRRAAAEKLGSKDPARTMLHLAADQLENAADSALLLEQILADLTIGKTKLDNRKSKPANAAQWEGDRIAEIRKAKLEGLCAGLAIAIAIVTVIGAVMI